MASYTIRTPGRVFDKASVHKNVVEAETVYDLIRAVSAWLPDFVYVQAVAKARELQPFD